MEVIFSKYWRLGQNGRCPVEEAGRDYNGALGELGGKDLYCEA
jgi:hypothetical protein